MNFLTANNDDSFGGGDFFLAFVFFAVVFDPSRWRSRRVHRRHRIMIFTNRPVSKTEALSALISAAAITFASLRQDAISLSFNVKKHHSSKSLSSSLTFMSLFNNSFSSTIVLFLGFFFHTRKGV